MIRRDFGQFPTLMANRLSPERIEVSKFGKASDELQLFPRKAKFGELWCTNKKVIGAHVDPPTTRAVFRLMRLRSGHVTVTLIRMEFQPIKLSLQLTTDN